MIIGTVRYTIIYIYYTHTHECTELTRGAEFRTPLTRILILQCSSESVPTSCSCSLPSFSFVATSSPLICQEISFSSSTAYWKQKPHGSHKAFSQGLLPCLALWRTWHPKPAGRCSSPGNKQQHIQRYCHAKGTPRLWSTQLLWKGMPAVQNVCATSTTSSSVL